MLTLLGIPLDKIDKLKYIMQLRCVITWIKFGAKGTIEAATGFGKSVIGCLAIKKMILRNNSLRAMVVVPTIQLKEQWEGVLKSFGLSDYTKVLVINTIALSDKVYQVDLLIVDEVHMMAAPMFSRMFTLIKYKWLLGLTATLKRMDGKDSLLKQYAPIVKTITQKQAIANGWINNFIEINVPVHLTRDEKAGLHNLSKQIRSYAAKFGDFEVMRSCMNHENAVAYAKEHYPDEDSKYKAVEVTRDAVQGQRCVRKRQDFLYKTHHKVIGTVDLINEFGLKTITFSQSTEFADEVKKAVGKTAVAYHSNLETTIYNVDKSKKYKTLPAAQKWADKVGGIVAKGDGYIVEWKQPKKLGSGALKKLFLERFSNSTHGITTICTAKALDQGFDVPDVQLGIDGSRTSNPTQHTQRTGRIARKFFYKNGREKQGIYVSFYVPNSRDEEWLRSCQSNEDVIWVQDLQECIEIIRSALE